MLELLASDLRLYVQDVLALAICGAALVWGGNPERIVAATWLVFFELSHWIYQGLFGAEGFQLLSVDWFLSATDVIALIVWVAVALYANRNYTLWIAGMQLLAMTAHLARGLSEAISPLAYIFLVVAPGWFQLVFLGAGLTRHIMRKRKYGEYRDWRLVRKAVRLDLPGERPNSLTALIAEGKPVARDESR